MPACGNLGSRAPTKPLDPCGSRLTVRCLRWSSSETRRGPLGLDVRFWFQAMTFMLDCFLGSNCRRTSHHTACIQCGFRSIHLRPGESFENNFGHHAFVLVLQEVTVEYRDAANDRVCEIHDEIE